MIIALKQRCSEILLKFEDDLVGAKFIGNQKMEDKIMLSMDDIKIETSNVTGISRNILEILLTKVQETSLNCFEAGLKLRSKVRSEVLYEIKVKSDEEHESSSCSVTGEKFEN